MTIRTPEIAANALKEADRTEHPQTCRNALERLRFAHGLNYRESAEFAERYAGIDKERFEDLCQLADECHD